MAYGFRECENDQRLDMFIGSVVRHFPRPAVLKFTNYTEAEFWRLVD